MRKESYILTFATIMLFCAFCSIQHSFAQSDTINFNNDTIIVSNISDSTNNNIISIDTLASFPQDSTKSQSQEYQELSFDIAEDGLNSAIDYDAVDSFKVVIPLKTIFLYGNAHVVFEDFDLTAARVAFNWDKGEVLAHGVYNEKTGRMEGKPEFVQGGKAYLAEELKYNFKSKKGRSKGLVTQESEGFLHGMEIKSIGEDILYGEKVKYTTCDYEHPHFYLEVNKAKIVKDKVIVGKPVNLVVGDVHTPIVVPFGIFPLQTNRVSGIIFPQYGYSPAQGIYLTNGGYYWAINDNMDLSATGSIYSRGSWNVNTDFTFVKKYKYRGNLGLNFASTSTGEKRDPDYGGPRRDFKIRWDMRLDPKRLHNSSFNVSVNGGTSSYQRNVLQDQETALNTSLNSSLSYQKWWPGTPFRLSISAGHQQNTQSGNVNLKLPEFSFAMSSINPFERKVAIGGRKWYENITISYSMNARNELNAGDSVFFKIETLEEAKNGIRHTASVNMPLKVLKYFNLSTGFSYTDRWYFKNKVKNYNLAESIVDETYVNQFRSARDYNLNASLSWSLFGTFNFKNTKKVKAFRHVMRPSINFNYRPDFGKDRYNYFDTYLNQDSIEQIYSIFEGGIYGAPSRGTNGSIGFSLNNNFELKLLSRRDSIPKEKKVKLLDNFNLSTNYNIAADSLNLSPLSFNGSTRILDFISINFNGSLDPYYTNPETNRRVDQFLFTKTKRFFRLTRFTTSISGTFRSKKKTGSRNSNVDDGSSRGKLGVNDQGRSLAGGELPKEDRTLAYVDPVYGHVITYVDFDVPWSLSPSYNLSLQKTFNEGRDTSIVTQSLRLRGDVSLTKNWKLSASTGYDITNRKWNRTDITISRDLHCWQLGFNWTVNGQQQNYSIILNVKSQMLKFLELKKNRGIYDNNLFGQIP